MVAGIITGGTDRIAQETSLVVLDHLLDLLVKIGEKEMMAVITKKFLPLIYFVIKI